MTLMHIPLKNIIIKDLKSLIEEETSESLFLEYKAITYSKEDKEEFLKDISSFANSQGGDIIIGIEQFQI